MLLAFGLGSVDLPEWLIILLYGTNITLFTSQMVSGVGYINAAIDNVVAKTDSRDEETTREGITLFDWMQNRRQRFSFGKNIRSAFKDSQFVGIVVGVIGAIALTATMTAFHISPIHSFGSVISTMIAFIGNVSTFAGLGNRIGAVINYAAKEKKNLNYTIGITCGIIAGIILGALVVGLIGTTSAMTFGGAVPAWAGAGLFVASAIGTSASAGSYIGRICDLMFGSDRSLVGVIRDAKSSESTESMSDAAQASPRPSFVKRFFGKLFKTRQGRFAIAGVVTGIVIASILIATGLATLPFLGLGLPKLAAGIFVMSLCISAFGGLGYRVGTMAEKFGGKSQTQEPSLPHPPPPSPLSSIASTDSLEQKALLSQEDTRPSTPIHAMDQTLYGDFFPRIPSPTSTSKKQEIHSSPSSDSLLLDDDSAKVIQGNKKISGLTIST